MYDRRQYPDLGLHALQTIRLGDGGDATDFHVRCFQILVNRAGIRGLRSVLDRREEHIPTCGTDAWTCSCPLAAALPQEAQDVQSAIGGTAPVKCAIKALTLYVIEYT